MKILFVCTGNTCRSPMAEGLFRVLAPEHECGSAGLSAVPGQPASTQAVVCCEELGADISAHRSRQLARGELSEWDMFFPMTRAHGAVLEGAGVPPEKVYYPGEIADPYGGDLEVYRACRDRIMAELLRFRDALGGARIVPMELGHLPQVEAIERECFSLPWSMESFKEELINPLAVYVAAELQGRVAGYGGMRNAAGEYYIDNIAVAPGSRRRGIGRQIMSYLVGYAGKHGGLFVSLEVRPSNAPAIALYESLGFKKAGLRRDFYEKPREDGLIYTLTFKEEEGC